LVFSSPVYGLVLPSNHAEAIVIWLNSSKGTKTGSNGMFQEPRRWGSPSASSSAHLFDQLVPIHFCPFFLVLRSGIWSENVHHRYRPRKHHCDPSVKSTGKGNKIKEVNSFQTSSILFCSLDHVPLLYRALAAWVGCSFLPSLL
jgi:hypothetical protein